MDTKRAAGRSPCRWLPPLLLLLLLLLLLVPVRAPRGRPLPHSNWQPGAKSDDDAALATTPATGGIPQRVQELYRAELVLSPESAFVTHGAATFVSAHPTPRLVSTRSESALEGAGGAVRLLAGFLPDHRLAGHERLGRRSLQAPAGREDRRPHPESLGEGAGHDTLAGDPDADAALRAAAQGGLPAAPAAGPVGGGVRRLPRDLVRQQRHALHGFPPQLPRVPVALPARAQAAPRLHGALRLDVTRDVRHRGHRQRCA